MHHHVDAEGKRGHALKEAVGIHFVRHGLWIESECEGEQEWLGLTVYEQG